MVWPLLFITFMQLGFTDDFIIAEGSHYAQERKVGVFRGESLEISAYFDQSAQYDLGDDDQFDVNKLYGVSDCGTLHMKNSARMGWRWNLQTRKLEILAFTHVNGVFDFKLIGEAKLNQSYRYQIQLSSDKSSYLFSFNQYQISMPRGCQDTVISGYKLYPYFGGNKAAPHDIRIKIAEQNEKANFSLEKIYPNPVSNGLINLSLKVIEKQDVSFSVFDLNGRLVMQTSPISMEASEDEQLYTFQLPELSAGMYLIRPEAVSDGKRKLGFINGNGNALKLVVL